MSKFRIQTVGGLHDPVTGALAGFMGADGKEYLIASAAGGPDGAASAMSSVGLFQVAEAMANLSKVISANGAATSYTVAAKKNYAYLTTTAVAIAFTLPSAAAAIDGLLVTVVTDIAVATLTWASTGATFAGAPGASAANAPIRMIYDHASLKWYPV